MSKYVPPHLRIAGRAPGARPAGDPGGAPLENPAAAINNLLRARAAEDMGAAPPSPGGPQGGPLGAGGPQSEPSAAWGSWGSQVRKPRGLVQQKTFPLRVVEVDSLVIMKILKHWRWGFKFRV